MSNRTIKIGSRVINSKEKPFIIPEIGINHNGSLTTAFEMVDSAYRAGAEVIKHQTHIVEDEMSKHAERVVPGNSNKSIYRIMAECSLSEDEEIQLKKYVENKGMIFLSTPFSRAAANRLEEMDVVAYKIGSGECNNYPLIEHISDFGKPMIVSTGMNDIESVEKTVNILERKHIDYALLHTTNLYPTPSHLVRLGGMDELMKRFDNCVIGLSDHTISNLACFAAIAKEALIVERHYTDSKRREGPDIINSMDESELIDLIHGANEIKKMIGGRKVPAVEEKVTIDFAFATVVTISSIKKGENFTKDNIWVKRPGTGSILASSFEDILGKKATKDLGMDQHLNWEDIK